MTREMLRSMAETDIYDIDPIQVADFYEAERLSGETPTGMLEKFIKKGYNPYFRKSGGKDGCIVKISFANNGVRLSDAVADMLSG